MNTEEDSEAGTAKNGSQHRSEKEHDSMKEVRAKEGWRRKSKAQPVMLTKIGGQYILGLRFVAKVFFIKVAYI